VRAGIPETVGDAEDGHRAGSICMRYDSVSEGDLDTAAMTLNAAMTGRAGDSDGRRGRESQPMTAAS
jgi:hypothetical protein